MDIGYARTSGLQIVAPAATLTLDGASKTTVMFTPALEIGARFDIGPGRILRPYVVAGATILTDTSVPFRNTPVIARVEAGLQFYEVPRPVARRARGAALLTTAANTRFSGRPCWSAVARRAGA